MRHTKKIAAGVLICLSLTAASPAAAQDARFSDEDIVFLEKIQRRALDYFLNEADSSTGLVRDRAPNREGVTNAAPASIAASGYALSAYAVGVHHGWITRQNALNRTKRALRFAWRWLEHEHGFFYHFLSMDSGKRVQQSELSPIDTALFIMGALFAAEYFQDEEITQLAKQLYERVDFKWMQNGGKFLALSWSPERGFSERTWGHFDESLLMYILAIGSPTHPIDADVWHALRRPVGSYQSHRMVAMPPLFTHQYPHIWIDFRGVQDGFMNYFNHSITACETSRVFAMDEAETYKTYGPNSWGITASDGPKGYKAYGSPPGWAFHDGTIAPTGCGSCMPFTPKESLSCLRHFEAQGEKLWGRYGFADAFNDDENWVSPQVIAIDQGTLMLMIENAKNELLWKTMKNVPAIQTAFEKIGFQPGTRDLAWAEPPHSHAVYIAGGLQIDGLMKDWPGGIDSIVLGKEHAEFGEFLKERDAQAKIRFGWDENMLYFAVEVDDDSLISRQRGKNIWRDDLFELFIDPDGDGLYWEDTRDFQIGFRPERGSDRVATWSWFQTGEDPVEYGWVQARGYADDKGYVIEGGIRWSELGTFPRAGMKVNVGPAIHDVDQDGTNRKLQWFFRSEAKMKRFQLGRITLEVPRGCKEETKSPYFNCD